MHTLMATVRLRTLAHRRVHHPGITIHHPKQLHKLGPRLNVRTVRVVNPCDDQSTSWTGKPIAHALQHPSAPPAGLVIMV